MPFGHALILQSSQHPTVSGFYKLLACCMTVCRQLDYFKVCVCVGLMPHIKKVHNIMAGTDIFSFRILHTIQYLVHGLT